MVKDGPQEQETQTQDQQHQGKTCGNKKRALLGGWGGGGYHIYIYILHVDVCLQLRVHDIFWQLGLRRFRSRARKLPQEFLQEFLQDERGRPGENELPHGTLAAQPANSAR